MLNSTFCCFKGISPAAERRLWQAGILTWSDFLRAGRDVFSEKKVTDVCGQILEAQIALEFGLPDYFLNRLPGSHKIRIWRDFESRLLALDIETDGLSARADVLCITVGTRGGLRTYVKGRDLAQWVGSLAGKPVLVTYNGRRFDLPILRRRYGIDLAQPHIDLMDVFHGFGFKGGQKAVERKLRIARQSSEGMDGGDVKALWNKWVASSDMEVVRRLVRYNAEDVAGLLKLGETAYQISMREYPLTIGTSHAPEVPGEPEWFGSLTT